MSWLCDPIQYGKICPCRKQTSLQITAAAALAITLRTVPCLQGGFMAMHCGQRRLESWGQSSRGAETSWMASSPHRAVLQQKMRVRGSC